MPKPFTPYQRGLPEIPNRKAHEEPVSHLVKDLTQERGWRIAEGRRPSSLLLIEKLRREVRAWRKKGYPRSSPVTKRLFRYWFDEDHIQRTLYGEDHLRYHFCQREAIETLVYLVEVFKKPDSQPLLKQFARSVKDKDIPENYAGPLLNGFQNTMDDERQAQLLLSDRKNIADLPIPPENLRRYAFRMATGTGKTWVMAMAIVWAYFRKLKDPNAPLSTNFLILAPNVIVYRRLLKDFGNGEIFKNLPLIPPEWKSHRAVESWYPKIITRDNWEAPHGSCNIILANIQQLYEREKDADPKNPLAALVEAEPSNEPSRLDEIGELRDLIVINDEAHHLHDEKLLWNESLHKLRQALNMALWLDFSATPRDSAGNPFPWTICDYPLAQAVEDRIIKVPLPAIIQDGEGQPVSDYEGKITKDNAVEKYGLFIDQAVNRFREHQKNFKQIGVKPVLFVMADNNAIADAIGNELTKNPTFRFNEEEVVIIHSDKSKNDVQDRDLEKLREIVQSIDDADNRIKVIVSVLMLREGWDVKNVSVVLGLRPFTAKAKILPEQVIGRGVRLMDNVSPDKTQTLEVLGTYKLIETLRDQLETEGVVLPLDDEPPLQPVLIRPIQERAKFDITLPFSSDGFQYDIKQLENFNPLALKPCAELSEDMGKWKLSIYASPVEAKVHEESLDIKTEPPSFEELLSEITEKVARKAQCPSQFALISPIVETYILQRCFKRQVERNDKNLRAALSKTPLQEKISDYLAEEIRKVSRKKTSIVFERFFKLSETRPFHWRQNLPLFQAQKTIFNYVATCNDFEKRFAKFLDRANDCARFASLASVGPDDSSGTKFRIPYLKPNHAIGYYYPDWVLVQKKGAEETCWIVETKGRVGEETKNKDKAASEWCEKATKKTKQQWTFLRVNQETFKQYNPKTVADLQ